MSYERNRAADRAAVPAEADRRTVRRVAAVGAAAIAVTALATAGIAQNASAQAPIRASLIGMSAMPGASSSPSAAPSTAPSTSPSTAASPRPQLKVSVVYKRTGRELTLTISFEGVVIEPLATDGTPLTFPTPATRDIGLGEKLSWGDGSNADVTKGLRRCPKDSEPRTLHQIQDTYSVSHTYIGPGTYTVDYAYFACGLTGGKIAGQLQIVVPR